MSLNKYMQYQLVCDNPGCSEDMESPCLARMMVNGFFPYKEAIEWAKKNGWVLKDRNRKTYCCFECFMEATNDPNKK